MRAGSNWRHLNGLSLGMMGDPVRCLPKVVHPDVAALKLQHNRDEVLEEDGGAPAVAGGAGKDVVEVVGRPQQSEASEVTRQGRRDVG